MNTRRAALLAVALFACDGGGGAAPAPGDASRGDVGRPDAGGRDASGADGARSDARPIADAGPGGDARPDAGPGEDARVNDDAGPRADARVGDDARPTADARVDDDAGPVADAHPPAEAGPDAALDERVAACAAACAPLGCPGELEPAVCAQACLLGPARDLACDLAARDCAERVACQGDGPGIPPECPDLCAAATACSLAPEASCEAACAGLSLDLRACLDQAGDDCAAQEDCSVPALPPVPEDCDAACQILERCNGLPPATCRLACAGATEAERACVLTAGGDCALLAGCDAAPVVDDALAARCEMTCELGLACAEAALDPAWETGCLLACAVADSPAVWDCRADAADCEGLEACEAPPIEGEAIPACDALCAGLAACDGLQEPAPGCAFACARRSSPEGRACLTAALPDCAAADRCPE